MTPQYIMRKSLCREPHCAGPRDIPFADWPQEAIAAWRRDAENEIENMDWSEGYAEPGYDQPRKGILFANWNLFSRGLDTILESAGYAIEWSDEWTRCDGCYRALRTTADSWVWQPAFMQNRDSGDCYCRDCIADDSDAFESYENNPRSAINVADIDLNKFGYVEIECGFESGWFPGQNDKPQEIFDKLKGRYSRIVFQVSEQSQFYCGFCVWHKPCEGCGGKRYRDATRDDGRAAVERCDTCSENTLSDEETVPLALKDGIVAIADYPAFIICRHPI